MSQSVQNLKTVCGNADWKRTLATDFQLTAADKNYKTFVITNPIGKNQKTSILKVFLEKIPAIWSKLEFPVTGVAWSNCYVSASGRHRQLLRLCSVEMLAGAVMHVCLSCETP